MKSEEAASPASEDSYPKMPAERHLCTPALFAFLRRHRTIFDFFLFGVTLATQADRVVTTAAKALAAVDEENRKKYEELKANENAIFKQLQSFSSMQSENMCIRLADNFLCFLSESIQRCMSARPEMLRSSETIKIEDVLRFATRESLIEFLVERKVNEISYGGVREIEAFILERTGIALTTSDEQRGLLIMAVELRNLYTHNRGVVNEVFLRRMRGIASSYSFERGKHFHANFEAVARSANVMFDIAVALDRSLSLKFKLKRKRFSMKTKSGSDATRSLLPASF